MSLVAILDADKEGFLRSERSLIQTVGRAAMEKAISETNRRRRLQKEYNEANGITPQTIKKSVRDTIKATIVEDIKAEHDIKDDEDISEVIEKLTNEMIKYAQELEFEKAAELRDKIKELENIV